MQERNTFVDICDKHPLVSVDSRLYRMALHSLVGHWVIAPQCPKFSILVPGMQDHLAVHYYINSATCLYRSSVPQNDGQFESNFAA